MKNKTIVYFVMLSIVASLLNYATYPLLARALPDEHFVNMTVALSLLTQMATLLASIVAVATGLTKEDKRSATKQIEILQTVLIYLLIVVLGVFLLLAPTFLPLIGLAYIYLVPISFMLLFSIPIAVISGFFNGKKLIIKLGTIAVLSAFLQFILSVSVGFITKNGALALIAMASGQLVSIFLIMVIYRKDHLPNLKKTLGHKLNELYSPAIRSLVRFTVFSSLGVLLINILQIADLLAVQNMQIDEKLYTDLYVLSRVIFFAGTIFIWPFISMVSLDDKKNNIRNFVKLFTIVSALSIVAIVGIIGFGDIITRTLFNVSYDKSVFLGLGTLSILYKYLYVLLFALILFFIVVRNYLAFYLPLIIGIVSYAFLLFASKQSSVTFLLVGLNTIALAGVLISLMYFLKNPTKKLNN